MPKTKSAYVTQTRKGWSLCRQGNCDWAQTRGGKKKEVYSDRTTRSAATRLTQQIMKVIRLNEQQQLPPPPLAIISLSHLPCNIIAGPRANGFLCEVDRGPCVRFSRSRRRRFADGTSRWGCWWLRQKQRSPEGDRTSLRVIKGGEEAGEWVKGNPNPNPERKCKIKLKNIIATYFIN